MRIGGAYMSLDDFERTQIDSIVTGIAAEYEADGTAIDHIEVKNTMKEDDLLWIIAINSAAYEQNLDAMSAELIQNSADPPCPISHRFLFWVAAPPQRWR